MAGPGDATKWTIQVFLAHSSSASSASSCLTTAQASYFWAMKRRAAGNEPNWISKGFFSFQRRNQMNEHLIHISFHINSRQIKRNYKATDGSWSSGPPALPAIDYEILGLFTKKQTRMRFHINYKGTRAYHQWKRHCTHSVFSNHIPRHNNNKKSKERCGAEYENSSFFYLQASKQVKEQLPLFRLVIERWKRSSILWSIHLSF